MHKIVTKLLAFCVGALPTVALADFSCTVKINSFFAYNDGTVMVNHTGRNDLTMICNLNTQWNGITPATCSLWASTIQGVKRANGNATFYYPGAGSCAAMATYGNSPAPIYVAYVP